MLLKAKCTAIVCHPGTFTQKENIPVQRKSFSSIHSGLSNLITWRGTKDLNNDQYDIDSRMMTPSRLPEENTPDK